MFQNLFFTGNMKQFLNTLQRMLILILFCSCGAGISDYTADLGSGYHYNVEGRQDKFIYYSKEKGRTIDKTIVYPCATSYEVDDEYIVITQNPNRAGIRIMLGFSLVGGIYTHYTMLNDSLALQRSAFKNKTFDRSDSIIVKQLLERGYTEKNSIRDQELEKEVADSILKSDPRWIRMFENDNNYYIIEKQLDKIHGPMNKQAYLAKRKVLGVPDGLQLEEY